MESENLRFLIAENERLRRRAGALESQLARAPQNNGRGRTSADELRRELSRKAGIQVESSARGSLFALAEGLQAAADLLAAVSGRARRREQPAELSRASRRVLQKYFEFYGDPYPLRRQVAPRNEPSGPIK
jgi:hypothetical protein